MLSEDSELSDLSSIEEDGPKSAGAHPKSSAGGKQKGDGYRLHNILKPGRTTHYTAKALYDQIHQNDIELDPEYQRDVVWSDAKQIGLIDSIFRNFYVPPIIFSVTIEDDGTEKRVCIDGKQRLISIQKFIGGLIPHRDPFTNEKLWFVDSPNGPKRKLLPPRYKTMFQNKQIVCIEYSDLPGDLEREVFQRVQLGMALTTAEKLQAISAPWPNFVRDILHQYLTGQDSIASNMDIQQSRARDFHNVAQTLFSIDHLPDHVQGTPLQLEKWLQNDAPSDSMRAKIHDVFRIYKELANHTQFKAPFKKPSRVAPVEFIMIAVLIAVHKNTLSLPQLSQAIGILRNRTRNKHTDIRTNSKVYKTMFDIISKDIKPSALKESPNYEAAGIMPSTSTNSSLTKRKRDGSGDEHSSDGDRGSDRAEQKPKPAKRRSTPSHPTSVSKPHLSKSDPPALLHIKIEENGIERPPAVANHDLSRASSGPRGIERIKAAKLQSVEILNAQPASSMPSPQQYPAKPHIHHGQQQSLLESNMMSPTANSAHRQSTSTSNPTLMTNTNGVHAPRSAVPIPNDGINNPRNFSDDYPRTSRWVDDSHRRHDISRSSREEYGDGIYHGRNPHDDRRDRDQDRISRFWERDGDRDREYNRDRDQSRSHSRGSYSSRSDLYHKSRGNPYADRRASGHHDR